VRRPASVTAALNIDRSSTLSGGAAHRTHGALATLGPPVSDLPSACHPPEGPKGARGPRRVEPWLHPVHVAGALFEPPRQFPVAHGDFAQFPPGIPVMKGLGSGQDFFGARLPASGD
jgi:hypothetical protein